MKDVNEDKNDYGDDDDNKDYDNDNAGDCEKKNLTLFTHTVNNLILFCLCKAYISTEPMRTVLV